MKKIALTKGDAKRYLFQFWKWFVLPALIYGAIFFITQPHYLTNFSNGFFLDKGDGYQNVWNIWWVEDSIVDNGQSPYFTTMVHWPHGSTLVPQTMNIFNGLIGIILQNVFRLNLIQTVNFVVVFSFVMSGITMLWFIQKLYKKYWVSIIAGALYTFSSFHFAHAVGHLQLVSFEWIPLFLLAFWNLIERVRYRDAIFAAFALFLVLTTDYYYLLWCIFLGAGWLGWCIYKKKIAVTKHMLRVFSLFAGLCLVLVGPLMYQLWNLSKGDQLLGNHDALAFSLDPITIFLPGGSWNWGELTSSYWEKLPYIPEVSVYFGLGLLTLLAVAFFYRKRLKAPSWLWFWWGVLFVFGVLAMGPRLTTFGGKTLDSVPLPYAWLVRVMPSLKISGMPVRWMLVALIAAIVIGSFVLSKINLDKRTGQVLLGVFIVVTVIDLFPFRLPLSVPSKYPYVEFLKVQPRGAVIDDAAPSATEQLYNQTQHEQPMAFGYTTRIPRDVDEKNFHIFAALAEGRLQTICQVYKIRYITLPNSRPLSSTEFPIVYQDDQAIVYDMKNSENC